MNAIVFNDHQYVPVEENFIIQQDKTSNFQTSVKLKPVPH